MNLLDMLLADAVEKKMRFIHANREKYVEAWLAETGLLPSETVLIQKETYEDGKMVIKVWCERRDPEKGIPR